jgi:hypothetical protein
MSKQTAVEWFYKKLKNYKSLNLTDKLIQDLYKQALQMEKEQMIEFIKKAPIKTGLLREPDIYYIIDAESHYNETYGGNNDN